MTWELASFVVLGLALLGGVTWYERSRPPAKVVALVAALAALATLGRLAFAPLPNVKPTTDIVLLSGFALGGAPGFAVGAVTALVSNVVFGQGPWTPWQMVGWGMVGVGGAVLARLVGAHIGRIGLALACGLAGLGFGMLMNVFTWITFGGEQSWAQLLAIIGTAVPFDAAHVIGNVLFALAFGPLLLRMLSRYRDRLDVAWVDVGTLPTRPLALVVVLAMTAVGAAGMVAAPAAEASVASSVRYLERAQNTDGGFGPAPGARSTTLHTGWAALGLAAAGRNPLDVQRAGRSPVDHMRSTLGSMRDTGGIERTILVLDASGVSPRSFGGRDLVRDLRGRQRRNGSFNGQVTLTAFGAMALKAAGGSAAEVRRAGAWLAGQQNTDGGFSFAQRGGQSSADDTAGAIQGLVAAGRKRTRAVSRAIAYLQRVQNTDGGFPLLRYGRSNAQSSAYVLQALIASGRGAGAARRSGHTAVGYLRSLTLRSGMVRYARGSSQTPVWVTAQAVAALSGRPFPVSRVAKRARGTRAGVAAVGAATLPGTTTAPPAAAPAAAAPAATPPGASAPGAPALGAEDAAALPPGADPATLSLGAWKLAARRLGRLFFIGLAPIT